MLLNLGKVLYRKENMYLNYDLYHSYFTEGTNVLAEWEPGAGKSAIWCECLHAKEKHLLQQ